MTHYIVLVIRRDGNTNVSLFTGKNRFGVMCSAHQAAVRYLMTEDHGLSLENMGLTEAFEALQEWMRESEDGELDIFEVEANGEN